MDDTPKLLDSKVVFRSNKFDVELSRFELSDGAVSERSIVRHAGAVVVLPFSGKNEIILIKQYRYSLQKEFLELPAGTLEKGEDPLEAAKRELLEETGYAAAKWTGLGSAYPSVGISDELMHFYAACDLSFKGAHPEAGELIDLLRLTVAEARDAVRDNRIMDMKTAYALIKAQLAGLIP